MYLPTLKCVGGREGGRRKEEERNCKYGKILKTVDLGMRSRNVCRYSLFLQSSYKLEIILIMFKIEKNRNEKGIKMVHYKVSIKNIDQKYM